MVHFIVDFRVNFRQVGVGLADIFVCADVMEVNPSQPRVGPAPLTTDASSECV